MHTDNDFGVEEKIKPFNKKKNIPLSSIFLVLTDIRTLTIIHTERNANKWPVFFV